MDMMSAIKGMSRNISLDNASAPGEWKCSEELQAKRLACMAVARVSSITALPSCTDRGFLEWTTDRSTCPIVWWIRSINELPCGFRDVVENNFEASEFVTMIVNQ